MQVGQHVQDKEQHTGHITAVVYAVTSGDLIVEVQWDDRPWGKRVWLHERHLVHDYPADARSRAHWQAHKDAYDEASAAGRYQGD